MSKYQRSVRFEYHGLYGRANKNDQIVFCGSRFHLDDLDIQSGIRQVIHKIRNGERREPSHTQP